MTEEAVKRTRRTKKQQYIDARDNWARKQKIADDSKTVMQLAYQAWQSELEKEKAEFEELSKGESE